MYAYMHANKYKKFHFSLSITSKNIGIRFKFAALTGAKMEAIAVLYISRDFN